MSEAVAEPNKSNKWTAKLKIWWVNLKLGQKIKQDYYLTIYRFGENKLLFVRFIRKNVFWFISLLYFAGLLGTAFFVSRQIQDISKLDVTSFIVAAAAMLGGMLAIVFSVQTILMQNAAERSSSGFFKALAQNAWQSVVFWLIAVFILCLFVIAFSSQYLSGMWYEKVVRIQVPLDIIGITLWLLYQS